jgi:hypothetical protein
MVSITLLALYLSVLNYVTQSDVLDMSLCTADNNARRNISEYTALLSLLFLRTGGMLCFGTAAFRFAVHTVTAVGADKLKQIQHTTL